MELIPLRRTRQHIRRGLPVHTRRKVDGLERGGGKARICVRPAQAHTHVDQECGEAGDGCPGEVEEGFEVGLAFVRREEENGPDSDIKLFQGQL